MENKKELSYQEKQRHLYFEQKKTLDLFLERGAISKVQYDKSLGDLTEKMGIDLTVDTEAMTDDEKIDVVARRIMEEYRPHLKNLQSNE